MGDFQILPEVIQTVHQPRREVTMGDSDEDNENWPLKMQRLPLKWVMCLTLYRQCQGFI